MSFPFSATVGRNCFEQTAISVVGRLWAFDGGLDHKTALVEKFEVAHSKVGASRNVPEICIPMKPQVLQSRNSVPPRPS